MANLPFDAHASEALELSVDTLCSPEESSLIFTTQLPQPQLSETEIQELLDPIHQTSILGHVDDVIRELPQQIQHLMANLQES